MALHRVFIKGTNDKVTLLQKFLNIVIAVAIFLLFFFFSAKRLNINFDFSFLWTFRYRLIKGFATTVELSLVSLILSLLLGFLSAMANNSRILAVSYFSKVYVQFFRGTPMIMQIYLFFYIVGTAWGVDNRFLAGVLILSLFEGAYIAEIIRGGIDSIEPTQLEAAKAVGLEARQTLRLIVLPQIIKRTLPALAGQFASIIKDSSLLSLISVIELTQTIREISASNFAIFESYIFLGLLYLSLTFPISLYTRYLEGKFSYEN
ncbi:MAG: amino acid ABC transporter permease [Peptococcaceae bacterium]|nr:amino acid ABC transporter permease [Peptococcaceae bacterium]